MSLPEGYGFVPGKSRDKAIRLLNIAEDLGLPLEVIEASHDGYRVPNEVLDVYDRAIRTEDEVIEEAPASGPVTFDTVTEEESGGYEPATPDNTRIIRPKRNASHAKWLAFAQVRPGYTEADAELSRDELAAKYGD